MMSDNLGSDSPELQMKRIKPSKLDKANGQTMPEDAVVRSGGDNVVPMPAKKEGLTLASLSRATVKSGTTPLTAASSTMVIIEVAKPSKGVPFRAHPDEAFTLEGYSLTIKKPGVIGDITYLLDPSIAEMILPHVRFQRFCLCWDAWQARPFIWPVNIAVEGERPNGWVTSANRIWEAAKADWVCLIPGGGAYQLGKPVAKVEGEPDWPVRPFPELMIMAFRDLYIGADDREHKEVVKRMVTIVPE
jgi:hypothetical protein